MNALRAWRLQFGVAMPVAAAVLGLSETELERMEAGELEPAEEVALRIHIVSGGAVPLSAWENVRVRLLDGGLRLSAVALRMPTGGFGVGIFLGGEAVVRLELGDAQAFRGELGEAIELATYPPAPEPAPALETAP